MALYLAGKNATCTIDGVAMAVMNGTIQRGQDVDEVTNIHSGGYYEDVATIKKATAGGMEIVYDGEAPPTFDEGDLVAMSVSIPGGPSISGTFRIGSMTVTLMSVRQAVKFSFDATSQGVYTWNWS